MLVAVLSGYLLALLVPAIVWAVNRAAGPLMAALPGFLFAYLLQFVPEAALGRPWRFASPWDAVSGLEVSFRADGLSLLFGLLITLVGAAALIATASVALNAATRQRLLLALAALIASCLGLVFADQPLLVVSFAAATSLSTFLVVTADEGLAARTRYLPVLMLWLLADFALLVLFARLFSDLPGGLLGADGVSALPANGRLEPAWLVLILAMKIVPVFALLGNARTLSAPAAAVLAGMLPPALLILLVRLAETLPAEGKWALGALAAVGVVGGGLFAVGSARLGGFVRALTVIGYSAAALGIAVGSDASLAAALLACMTCALGLAALSFAAFGADGEAAVAELRGGFLRAPLTASVLGLGVLLLCGVLPSVGFLAALAGANAGTADAALIASPVLLFALAFGFAAALRVLVPISARKGAGNPPRVRLTLAGMSFLLLAFAVAAGLMPGFLARALLGPALKIAAPDVFGLAPLSGGLLGGALVLGGVLWWQQRFIAAAAAIVAALAARVRVPTPMIARRVWAYAGKAGLGPQVGLLGAAAVLVVVAAAGLTAAWPQRGFAVDVPDPMLMALGAIAAVAAGLALFERRLAHAVPLIAIAGLLCVLVALTAGAVDLAFVLLLILVIETVVLIAMSGHGAAAPGARAKRPIARGVIAALAGALVTFAGFEAAPAGAALQAKAASAASGITGLISGSDLALGQTGLIATERWAGIVLLLALFGIAAAHLWRRTEDDA